MALAIPLGTPPRNCLLTLTFERKYQRFKPKTLHRRTMEHVLFNMSRICDNYSIFPELTDAGMLHYHIIFKTSNFVRIKAFRGFWSRLYGFTNLKYFPDKDYLNVFIYCRKDNFRVCPILGIRGARLGVTSARTRDFFMRELWETYYCKRKEVKNLQEPTTRKINESLSSNIEQFFAAIEVPPRAIQSPVPDRTIPKDGPVPTCDITEDDIVDV